MSLFLGISCLLGSSGFLRWFCLAMAFSLATLISFFFLAAMISHSRVSTMVLGVTPVTFSKRGVVAHPDNMNDTKRIDAKLRMTVPQISNACCSISSIKQDRCVSGATDWQFLAVRVV